MKSNSKKAAPKETSELEKSDTPSVDEDAGDAADADEMSDAELAAFNSIMQEIEGRTSPPGSAGDDDVGTGDSTGERSRPSPADPAGDALDEEQQKAFESIMAQIESGNDQKPDADAEDEPGEAAWSDPDDTFAAELEKVAREAEAVEDDAEDGSASDDEPDSEQQKAVEEIMARIENDGDQEAGGIGDARTPDSDLSGGDVDFSAELEKVVQEAGAAGAAKALPEEAETEELDEEQQKAFESIMAQIQGGSGNDAEPENEPAGAAASPQDESDEASEAPSDGPPETGARGAAHRDEATDDIEKILKEIAVDSGQPPEAVSTPEDAPEEINGCDPEAAAIGAGPPEGQAVAAVQALPDESVDEPPTYSDASGETPGGRSAKSRSRSDRSGGPENRRPAASAKPLKENGHPGGKSKQRAAVVVVGILAVFVLAVYGWRQTGLSGGVPLASISTDSLARPPAEGAALASREPNEETLPAVQALSDRSQLTTTVEQLDQLRGRLIEKRTEIEDLRAYYQAGIDAEIEEIEAALARSGSRDLSFKRAMADTPISLGLSAIQRRDVYIRKLVDPSDLLYRASEELLFWSRRAELLAMMEGKTSDIDIDGYIADAAAVMDRHAKTLAALNIDDVPATPARLESIWEKIVAGSPDKAVDGVSGADHAGGGDSAAISRQICDGDFSLRDRLTTLSPEVARCLANWKGKDLFLNALTELHPDAARHLADWQGDWLGLNGLTDLSPETAAHLARWKGKGLSLNGLSRLSPRVVAILSGWQGDQIELVNVKHLAHWENPSTRLHLSEDLKRKRHGAGE